MNVEFAISSSQFSRLHLGWLDVEVMCMCEVWCGVCMCVIDRDARVLHCRGGTSEAKHTRCYFPMLMHRNIILCWAEMLRNLSDDIV